MKVLVEFERSYSGPSSDAVWIIDTSENRRWFTEQVGTMDANSALFAEDADPLAVIFNVFDHHPGWTEINVRGTDLTPEIETGVQPEAIVLAETATEFQLRRP